MIRCNLSVLLAERGLRITKVATDTKISRTTLTSIALNHGRGIQFDTLNTLCNYLNVTPNEIISYIPFDIKINNFDYRTNTLDINISKANDNRIFNCSLCCYCEVDWDNGEICQFDIDIQLWDADGNEEIEKENTLLIQVFSNLPIPFFQDLENEIVDVVGNSITHNDDTIVSSSCSSGVRWDPSLVNKNCL
ncbi:hypothetical protein EXM65_01690 [Clostridium botulinum]|uniref:HTH cro/C1-type domain-containing protein n=1 Tax=Clostridium botulinum TaxID=1491 RepID=A0A6M0SJY5_CLOBO|nr:hypothetical protein [Clostridium botulinum]